MAKLLSRCPVCEATLGISELACGRCQTRIKGAFDPCRFCRLAPEHLAFVEVFLRCEGNLSRVEKELGISYPTVRNRLTAALSALGFGDGVSESLEEPLTAVPTPPVPPVPPVANVVFVSTSSAGPEAGERRREVLEALAKGEMSADAAAEALRELS